MKAFRDHFDKKMELWGADFFRMPWEEKSFYTGWLAQTFYFVTYSTRILAKTASRFDVDRNEFHQRYVAHLREETGHETMALHDLKKLGTKPQDIPELPETSAFYQSQYFWIEQKNPISLFGYIIALEGFASQFGEPILRRVQASHGAEAATFLKVHAGADPSHLQEAFSAIEALSKAEIDLIRQNFDLSGHHYMKILQALTNLRAQGQRRSA